MRDSIGNPICIGILLYTEVDNILFSGTLWYTDDFMGYCIRCLVADISIPLSACESFYSIADSFNDVLSPVEVEAYVNALTIAHSNA